MYFPLKVIAHSHSFLSLCSASFHGDITQLLLLIYVSFHFPWYCSRMLFQPQTSHHTWHSSLAPKCLDIKGLLKKETNNLFHNIIGFRWPPKPRWDRWVMTSQGDVNVNYFFLLIFLLLFNTGPEQPGCDSG